MQSLTAEGTQVVNELSQRHGFSPDAVTHMLFAVLNGNGSMAQFSHSEFGGGGQWMRGGMLMLGDMFNQALKGRVDALCNDLSGLLDRQPGLLRSGSFQSQSQSGSGNQTQSAGGMVGSGRSSLFVPDPRDQWWPPEFGAPSATGAQNAVKYAYFATIGRLAVETGGELWAYDTGEHQIGGFSQQQGMNGSITFTSQYGTVDLARLPVVWRNGQAMAPPAAPAPSTWDRPSEPSTESTGSSADIFAAIERLADLHAKGILTDTEMAAKKQELLARL